ncbi:MAG: chain length determinant protein EpsF [Methylophilus sp.]|nr:chain length determinant protein EpsF [Methylophilus sp.]
MSFSQLLAILNARKLIAIWVLIVTVLVTTVISFMLPNSYKASTSLVINAKGADPITGFMLPAALMPGYIATQTGIIQSQNVALKVVDKLKIDKNPTAVERFEKATKGRGDIKLWYANQFMQNLEVKPSRETSLIEIGYTAADPEFAATMANAFAQAYIDTSLQMKVDPSKQAAVFFDNQVKELRANVEKSQAKLSAFQKEHSIASADGRLDVEMARLSELSSQLVVAQAQTYDSNSRRTQLNKGSLSDSPEILSNSLIQGLKSQLVQAESRLSDVSQRLGVNHPQYQAAQDDVENIRKSIQTEIAKTSGGVGQSAKVSQLREGEIRAALEAQKQRVLKLKSEQDEMAVLVREADSAQRIYDNALLRFGQTNMESQSGQTDISILNPATAPLEHSSPKRTLNVLLSIFLGALLATVFAIAAELLDRRVRSSEDLFKLINIPVLAEFSKVSGKQANAKKWLEKIKQVFGSKSRFNNAAFKTK